MCYFEECLTYPLDDMDNLLGERFSHIGQVLKALRFAYSHWTGRVPGYILNYWGKILPRLLLSIITSCIYSANIVLALKIIWKRWDKIFNSPMYILALYFAMYWYCHLVYFTYMWTMTSIYPFSLLLILLYYVIFMDYFDGSHIIKRKEWFVLQILGILAGMSHEVIAFCLMIALLITCLGTIINKRRYVDFVIYNIGLATGYCIGFFRRVILIDKSNHMILSHQHIVKGLETVF